MKKDEEEFVLIFEHGDAVRAGIVKSLLEDAGINCLVKSEGVQNLFGLGSIGGINPLVGTVKIFVRPEDKEEAQKVLSEAVEQKEFNVAEEDSEKTCETQPESTNRGKGFLSKLRRWFIG